MTEQARPSAARPSIRRFRRRAVQRLLAGLCLALAGPAAFAADPPYPSRPITLVVPFAAGGSLDVTARIISEKLREVLGQPVLIANRPGAGSAVGARSVATAPADGYTLLFASGSAFGFLHLLVPSFDFQLGDFMPIAAVATNSALIAASTAVPIKSLAELVEFARSKPAELNFCSTGVSGLNHLQLEMFKGLVKAKLGGQEFNVTHVPYNGVAPALTGLRGQSVQACTLPYSALVKNLDGKDLRVLAVMRPTRLASMPNVPTTGEQGYAEMDGNDSFVNISAPKGTPPAVLARLEAAFRQALQDPAIVKKLDEIDVQPTFMGSRETQKWLEDDVRKYSAIVRAAGLAVSR
jgi:tripartite-type tricarboxylate transporter receptor subunit TctC